MQLKIRGHQRWDHDMRGHGRLTLHLAPLDTVPSCSPLEHRVADNSKRDTKMTKATRFLTIVVPAVIVYLLMLINVLPLPLVSNSTAQQILPVVCLPAGLGPCADANRSHGGCWSRLDLTP